MERNFYYQNFTAKRIVFLLSLCAVLLFASMDVKAISPPLSITVVSQFCSGGASYRLRVNDTSIDLPNERFYNIPGCYSSPVQFNFVENEGAVVWRNTNAGGTTISYAIYDPLLHDWKVESRVSPYLFDFNGSTESMRTFGGIVFWKESNGTNLIYQFRIYDPLAEKWESFSVTHSDRIGCDRSVSQPVFGNGIVVWEQRERCGGFGFPVESKVFGYIYDIKKSSWKPISNNVSTTFNLGTSGNLSIQNPITDSTLRLTYSNGFQSFNVVIGYDFESELWFTNQVTKPFPMFATVTNYPKNAISTTPPLRATQNGGSVGNGLDLKVLFWDLSLGGQTINWAFGDGGSSSLSHPNHTYNTVGEFNVQQRITQSNGTFKTINKSIMTRNNNAISNSRFFVRQHYFDFLEREPDTAGLNYWTNEVESACADNSPPSACIARRTDVSAAFFIELEFEETGSYVYRLYKAAFGENPNYRPLISEFLRDRRKVIGGNGLEAQKLALANDFVNRGEFIQRYPLTLTSTQFVDAVLNTIKNGTGYMYSDAQRQSFINDVNSNGRGFMMYNLAREIPVCLNCSPTNFARVVYNQSFVLMQYFGYLRRDPDQAGYNFWLEQLNTSNNIKGMVCAFITSSEYQLRFGITTPYAGFNCNSINGSEGEDK
jgi:hypothetical protein